MYHQGVITTKKAWSPKWLNFAANGLIWRSYCTWIVYQRLSVLLSTTSVRDSMSIKSASLKSRFSTCYSVCFCFVSHCVPFVLPNQVLLTTGLKHVCLLLLVCGVTVALHVWLCHKAQLYTWTLGPVNGEEISQWHDL